MAMRPSARPDDLSLWPSGFRHGPPPYRHGPAGPGHPSRHCADAGGPDEPGHDDKARHGRNSFFRPARTTLSQSFAIIITFDRLAAHHRVARMRAPALEAQ